MGYQQDAAGIHVRKRGAVHRQVLDAVPNVLTCGEFDEASTAAASASVGNRRGQGFVHIPSQSSTTGSVRKKGRRAGAYQRMSARSSMPRGCGRRDVHGGLYTH